MVNKLRYIENKLLKGGVCEAKSEAKHIMSALLDIPIYQLYHKKYDDSLDTQIDEIISRRIAGQPLAYILEERWFMGYKLYVNEDVLIPRYDTEILCDAAVNIIKKNGYASVLDMCTGSGCIAISLAKMTSARIDALDISEKALKVAQKNAVMNNAEVTFFESDMFSDVGKRYDLIVCNPPYISPKEYGTLSKDALEYEPALALLGGQDGLNFYRILKQNAPKYTNHLLVEIGYNQGQDILDMMGGKIIKDLAGRDRVVEIKL